MDFSKLLSKITLLEAITMADIQTAVGQEKDEQKRAAILNDIAWKENLPGLYDPVSGYFVRKQSAPNSRNGGEGGGYSISATAREADTQALAKLGLLPGTAKTSALGGLVGTGSFSNSAEQNNAARKSVIDQSNKVYGGQASDKFAATKVAQLNDLVAKLTGKPTASAQIGADAAAYNAAKASTQKVNQGAQKAPAAKLPTDARGWDSQVQESLQRKMSALLNEEFGIGERVVGGEETPPGINRLTGKPIEPQAAPAAAEPTPAVVPLTKRFDPRFKNGPEPYTIEIDGTVYKFAGRDKAAPGGGEVIKVPAAVIGIRGLSAVSVELGKDGMYYSAPQQESVAESMSSLRNLLAELEEGAVGKYVGREAGEIAARDAAEAEVKALGNSAKAPYKMKGGAADISDAQIKDPAMRAKAMQWMKDHPGTSIGVAAAAVGATMVGLDASGRKNASTDPRVASNTPNPASQSDVRKVDNAIAAKAGAPAQAAQAATSTGPVTWRQIYDMNKDVIGSNPNIIKPGQQLKMPDGSTYTVNPGDNLSKIAKGAKGGSGAPAANPMEKDPAQLAKDKAGDKKADAQKSTWAGQTDEFGGMEEKPGEKKADAPAVTGPTPEQVELIKQIQATMRELEGNESPAVMTALSNAQTAIDSVGKAPAAVATPPAP